MKIDQFRLMNKYYILQRINNVHYRVRKGITFSLQNEGGNSLLITGWGGEFPSHYRMREGIPFSLQDEGGNSFLITG